MSLFSEMPAETLRIRLRALCAAACLSPSALAERAGKHPSLINKFLAGQTAAPTGETLAALERAALDAICGTPAPADPMARIGRDVAMLARGYSGENPALRRLRLQQGAAVALAEIARIDGDTA